MFSILLGSKEFSKQYTYLVTHTLYLSCGRWFSVIDLSHEKKMQKKKKKLFGEEFDVKMIMKFF